jgi:TRAP-type C4-dicarboxylate transport system permease small subunit
MKTISDRLGVFSWLLSRIGAVALFGMMSLTTADVIGRYLFNAPILGAFELTEYLVLILIFSFLGYTQFSGSHVSVELIVNFLPHRIQFIIQLVNHTLCLLLIGLVTWKSADKALELVKSGENSPNLSLPDYPFVLFLTLGCLVLCIEYLRNIIQIIKQRKGGTL